MKTAIEPSPAHDRLRQVYGPDITNVVAGKWKPVTKLARIKRWAKAKLKGMFR